MQHTKENYSFIAACVQRFSLDIFHFPQNAVELILLCRQSDLHDRICDLFNAVSQHNYYNLLYSNALEYLNKSSYFFETDRITARFEACIAYIICFGNFKEALNVSFREILRIRR